LSLKLRLAFRRKNVEQWRLRIGCKENIELRKEEVTAGWGKWYSSSNSTVIKLRPMR
jgi:hypothetical protein